MAPADTMARDHRHCSATVLPMSVDGPAAQGAVGLRAPAVLVVCVLVLAVCLTWTFFAMRAVMDVGGSCADGGPYVSAQPCPGGAGLIAIAIPVMVITAMAGSAAALSVSAPNLLIPMWGVPVRVARLELPRVRLHRAGPRSGAGSSAAWCSS